jgi:hypothetical protein
MLYFVSNLPIAFSIVYKEMGFQNMQVHVIYLTQMVSIYQLLWGFVLGVLQILPGMGSEQGSSLAEINSDFWSGVACFLHIGDECADHYSFSLLTGYCIINFMVNCTGLYLVKHDGAILGTLTNALVLPLTVLLFNMPLLGVYREEYNPLTIVGLGVVLIGFSLWRIKHFKRGSYIAADEDGNSSVVMSPVVTCGVSYKPFNRSDSTDSLTASGPSAFYDRVIALTVD